MSQINPRIRLVAASASLCLGLAASAHAQNPNDGLPEGPGKELILRSCTMCHSAAQIVYKPRAPDDWTDLIGKMVDRGAALTPEEQDAVYAYLVKNFGAKSATTSEGAEKGPSGR
jgi:hypothetical protein